MMRRNRFTKALKRLQEVRLDAFEGRSIDLLSVADQDLIPLAACLRIQQEAGGHSFHEIVLASGALEEAWVRGHDHVLDADMDAAVQRLVASLLMGLLPDHICTLHRLRTGVFADEGHLRFLCERRCVLPHPDRVNPLLHSYLDECLPEG